MGSEMCIRDRLTDAKKSKNFFLSPYLSEIRPKKGAKIINNKLADEFEIPRSKVRMPDGKISA